MGWQAFQGTIAVFVPSIMDLQETFEKSFWMKTLAEEYLRMHPGVLSLEWKDIVLQVTLDDKGIFLGRKDMLQNARMQLLSISLQF